jgi:hypothetical protein
MEEAMKSIRSSVPGGSSVIPLMVIVPGRLREMSGTISISARNGTGPAGITLPGSVFSDAVTGADRDGTGPAGAVPFPPDPKPGAGSSCRDRRSTPRIMTAKKMVPPITRSICIPKEWSSDGKRFRNPAEKSGGCPRSGSVPLP